MQNSGGLGRGRWTRGLLLLFAILAVLLAAQFGSRLLRHPQGNPHADGQDPSPAKAPVPVVLEKVDYAPPTADEALALELLDGAEKTLGNDLSHSVSLAWAAAFIHAPTGVERYRRLGDEAARNPFPLARSSLHASIAATVAPHDMALRDLCLKRAGVEARAALAEADLWKAQPLPPGHIPFQDPQTELNHEKLFLTLETELWEHVLLASQDRARGRAKVVHLMADPRAQTYFGGCLPRPFQDDLAEKLAQLDATLLLEAMTPVWEKEHMAEFCFRQALSRTYGRQRDSFTRLYIKHSIALRDNPRIRELQAKVMGWTKRDDRTRDPAQTQRGPLSAEEISRRRKFREQHDSDENRVLKNPGKTDWLKGDLRQQVLQQAAWQVYYETHSFEVFDEIIGGLQDGQEIDMVLKYNARQIAQYGDPAQLPGILNRIRILRLFVMATTDAARTLAERSERFE